MLNLEIDLEDGSLYIENELLCLKSEEHLVRSLSNSINLEKMEYNGHHKYFSEVFFLNQTFNLLITFFENKLYYGKIGLIWHSGNAYTKGYSVSENEIKQDVNHLAKLLETNYQLESSTVHLNKKEFFLSWGEIICGGSLHPPVASITISYNDFIEKTNSE